MVQSSCRHVNASRTPDAICAWRAHSLTALSTTVVQPAEGRESLLMGTCAPEMELCAPGYGNTGSPQPSQEGIDPEVAVASVKGVARRLKFIVDVLARHIRRCEGRISYEASSSLPGSRTHKGPGSSPAGREPRSLPATPGLQRTSALPTEPSEPRSPRRRPDLPRVLPPREPQLRPRDVYLTTRPRAPGTHTRNP